MGIAHEMDSGTVATEVAIVTTEGHNDMYGSSNRDTCMEWNMGTASNCATVSIVPNSFVDCSGDCDEMHRRC